MKEFYSVKEVAQIFGLTPNTVYSLLKGKQLAGCRIGRSWRIYKSEIEKFIQGV
jgi:excisionase family DNA binding protein